LWRFCRYQSRKIICDCHDSSWFDVYNLLSLVKGISLLAAKMTRRRLGALTRAH
jgi:hypothetical protein